MESEVLYFVAREKERSLKETAGTAAQYWHEIRQMETLLARKTCGKTPEAEQEEKELKQKGRLAQEKPKGGPAIKSKY
jgi:hypothetical protein